MHIKLNGKAHALEGQISVAALVETLGLNVTQVAIERNREIVPRSRWGAVMLDDADEIEIVKFIGGG